MHWLNRFGEWMRSFVESESLRISTLDDDFVVVRRGYERLVLNLKDRTVGSSGLLMASFDDISSVDIVYANDADGNDSWQVCLALAGKQKIHVGETRNDTHASIIAAQLGTLLGKKVLAFR